MKAKFETLNEAFKVATLQAEGYSSSVKAPIYKNNDGTFEVGEIQSQNWNDISDGTFEEIGGVSGWDVNFYDFFDDFCKISNKEKAVEIFNQNEVKWFDDFCERYEIEKN